MPGVGYAVLKIRTKLTIYKIKQKQFISIKSQIMLSGIYRNAYECWRFFAGKESQGIIL